MQQRQLRLGDILDDYCPRERRVTNHVVVAMIGEDVKQTRCTTCDADHEYKHARVPRQRRKSETAAGLYSQVSAAAPKRVAHDHPGDHAVDAAEESVQDESPQSAAQPDEPVEMMAAADSDGSEPEVAADTEAGEEGGPFESVHRPLIRATLPRTEGQPAQPRQAPDFTIRQPGGGGRPGRFRPRNQRAGQPFGGGSRASGSGAGNYGQSMRGGMPRQGGGGRSQDGNGNGTFRSGRNQGAGQGRRRPK